MSSLFRQWFVHRLVNVPLRDLVKMVKCTFTVIIHRTGAAAQTGRSSPAGSFPCTALSVPAHER